MAEKQFQPLYQIERAKELIAEGKGKTDIKKALRWQTVRKKLSVDQAREVEEAIDGLLGSHRSDPTRELTEKDKQRLLRRARKIV